MSGIEITVASIKQAERQTDRLSRELDITNADHIALWLEANMPDASIGYLACRIVEAYEAQTAKLLQGLTWALAELDGSTCYDDEQQRLNCFALAEDAFKPEAHALNTQEDAR